MSAKLTDKLIAQLYLNLASHYQECMTRHLNAQDIYSELWSSVNGSLHNRMSSLYGLDLVEQDKVYKILNTFIAASPLYRQIPFEHRSTTFTPPQQPIHVVYHHSYCNQNDPLVTWLLFDSLTRRPYYPHYPSHRHNQHRHSDEKKNEGSVIAFLLLLALAAAAVAASFVAMYYLLSEFRDGLERIWYKEGWMQASISMFSMTVGATASAILASALASTPLVSLALAAGIMQPAGVVILGVACLTIIGAAAVGFFTNQIQKYIIKNTHMDALDHQDPHRFGLTQSEEQSLDARGIDPIKVKCAITALRNEIGEKGVPSLLFTRSRETKECLDKIRALRSGQISQVDVGQMKFDCRKDMLYPLSSTPTFYQQSPTAPPEYLNDTYGQASAPPAPTDLYPQVASYSGV